MLNKTHTKYIQSLHHKKFRDAEDVFIAEGPKVVVELLQSHQFVCTKIFAQPPWLEENKILLKNIPHTEIYWVADFELQKISLLTTPHEVMAVFTKKKLDIKWIKDKGTITLALDALQDPGNFGTLIRTADWFGIKNIICSATCADMYNPKVVQSTMGSLARVNVYYTNLVEYLKKNNELKKYATALAGKSIKNIKPITQGIIIIGNEGKGISPEVMDCVDEKITIPKLGQAESLNAAVAAGIILAAMVLK